MLVSLIFFALTLCGLLLWLWIRLSVKGYGKNLEEIEQELNRISVQTSDQQLAKRGYFELVSEKSRLQTKIARHRNNQRDVLVLTGIFLVVSVILYFT